MRISFSLIIFGALLLCACDDTSQHGKAAAAPPFVRTTAVTGDAGAALGLSGTVRARVESPLAFQVGGRITKRRVDAGQSVRAGQPLFELDTRDLEQQVRAAEADLAAAKAALATADADLERQRQLQTKNFISTQAVERAQLLRQEAASRHSAALARQAQARNGLDYGALVAPAAGILIDVSGEPGQVVMAGQPVALLAQSVEREIEVSFPDNAAPPRSGEALTAEGKRLPLKLREVAGAVDPQSRTRRARYTVLAQQESLVLGAVLRARFATKGSDNNAVTVPLGAVDERGKGARVWLAKSGVVQPVAVTVLKIDGETAQVSGPLTTDDQVVALGTHLLTENMKVRELPR